MSRIEPAEFLAAAAAIETELEMVAEKLEDLELWLDELVGRIKNYEELAPFSEDVKFISALLKARGDALSAAVSARHVANTASSVSLLQV